MEKDDVRKRFRSHQGNKIKEPWRQTESIRTLWLYPGETELITLPHHHCHWTEPRETEAKLLTLLCSSFHYFPPHYLLTFPCLSTFVLFYFALCFHFACFLWEALAVYFFWQCRQRRLNSIGRSWMKSLTPWETLKHFRSQSQGSFITREICVSCKPEFLKEFLKMIWLRTTSLMRSLDSNRSGVLLAFNLPHWWHSRESIN